MKIFLGVLIFLTLVLMIPVKAVWNTLPELTLDIVYLFFKKRLLPKAEEPKAEKAPPAEKKEKPKKPKEKSKLPKPSISQLLDFTKKVLPKLTKSIRKLLKRTTVAKFKLRILVASNDAAETAIAFGKTNAAVANAIAIFDKIITLRAERIDIIPAFGQSEGECSCSGEVGLTPFAVLAAALCLGFWAIITGVPTLLGKNRKKTFEDKAGDGVGKEDDDGKETPLERGA